MRKNGIFTISGIEKRGYGSSREVLACLEYAVRTGGATSLAVIRHFKRYGGITRFQRPRVIAAARLGAASAKARGQDGDEAEFRAILNYAKKRPWR